MIDYNQIWCEEFGLLAEERDGVFLYLLKGCVIDGILYGDTTVTSVDKEKDVIFNYSLSQNYPNPFNSSTIIEYEIYSQSYINLAIYNSLGEFVSNLVNEVQPQDRYKIEFVAKDLPSGVYIYRLQSGDFVSSKKMLLLK